MRNPIFTQFKENLHIRLKNTHRDKASHTKLPTATKTKEIILKENLTDFNSSREAASDVETPMINQRIAPPRMQNANTVAILAIT